MSVASCDLLLAGGTVLALDDERRVLEDGAVAIAGDRIVAVDSSDVLGEIDAGRRVDCRAKVVLPGLVDCHNHLFQSLGRGLGEGLTGWRWLADFMWPYAAAISPEETRIAAYLGAIEAARSGTTALLDHHYGCSDVETTLAVASAIEDVGLRGVVARGIAGPLTDVSAQRGLPESAFRYSAAEELELTQACMEARPPGGRVTVWPGPINVAYTEPALLRDAVHLAREHGTGWHTHFCAPVSDPEIFVESHGVRPATWLRDAGLLDDRTTLAHCTWLDDEDVALIGGAGAGVAHCPVSNQYVPFGVMRLRDLRDAGAVVGLGSDGSACGHRQDMFEQMKQSVLLQRVSRMDPAVTDAEEGLELATREGARVLGIDAGVLAEGRLADVVVVDLDAPSLVPLNRAVASIVYAARGADVWMSIVGGEVIVEDGRCTRIDEEEVLAEASQRAGQLLDRAELRGLLRPWQHSTRRSGASAA